MNNDNEDKMMSEMPSELKYTSTHEWVRLIEDKTALIGITEHAQKLLGDMVFVELPEVGSMVSSQQELGVVESVKAASDFYTPIDGTVLEVNETLLDDPGLVNSEPYGSGWLVKLSIHNDRQLNELLDAEQYAETISNED